MRKAISTNAQHLRILLVDDEGLIRVMVADMLDELGHSVVAEAGELNPALTLARSADFDLAILDFNLNGKRIDPVAEAIIARRMPVISATGYSSPSIATRFSQVPRLRKPYGIEELGSAINRAIAAGTGNGAVA
jgi:CheY-like chemotaxis protein